MLKRVSLQVGRVWACLDGRGAAAGWPHTQANGELLGGGAAGADGEAGAAESEKEAGKDADELASKLESAAVAGEDGK